MSATNSRLVRNLQRIVNDGFETIPDALLVFDLFTIRSEQDTRGVLSPLIRPSLWLCSMALVPAQYGVLDGVMHGKRGRSKQDDEG